MRRTHQSQQSLFPPATAFKQQESKQRRYENELKTFDENEISYDQEEQLYHEFDDDQNEFNRKNQQLSLMQPGVMQDEANNLNKMMVINKGNEMKNEQFQMLNKFSRKQKIQQLNKIIDNIQVIHQNNDLSAVKDNTAVDNYQLPPPAADSNQQQAINKQLPQNSGSYQRIIEEQNKLRKNRSQNYFYKYRNKISKISEHFKTRKYSDF